MSKPNIKIYGERNTGTNYLSALIDLNLHVAQLPGTAPVLIRQLQRLLPGSELLRDAYFYITESKNLGWKHALVKLPELCDQLESLSMPLTFLTLTKNPYSWLLSLYKRPHSRQWRTRPPFEEFLNSTWKTVGRENAPYNFRDPIDVWNHKNAAYISLKKHHRTINIKYENLLQDPESILKEISDTVSCNWKSTKFLNIYHSTKDQGKDYAFYRNYYLEEQWKTHLRDPEIQIINQRLDSEVMGYFGYKKLYE
jgi:hypothetical protein